MSTSREEDIPEYIRSAVAKVGGRVSGARKRIVTFLRKAKTPISIQKIVQSVEVDEASVYRTIAFLKSLRLIEEIVLPSGERQYALIHEHHHHIICKKCSFVAHIPCTEKKKKITLSHIQFRTVTEHSVTYYGLCTKCHR